jgi:hypothetical protein
MCPLLKKKETKKTPKKYWIAAVFFAIISPLFLISKIKSRKKNL